MTTRTEWTGTASELLGGLAEQVGGTQRKSKSWPNARRALAGRLRPAATFLRKVGIEVTFRREGRAPTPYHPPDGRARKRRGATVRTVRIVRPRTAAGWWAVLRTITGPIPPQPSAPSP